MPVRSHVETVVNRTVDAVFPFVSDFTKLPTFDPAVLAIARTTEGPDRVGTVWTHTRKAGDA
jgi:Polyketide cyclase / dehydrase and lipid transport